MIRRYLPKSTEELIRWNERYVSPLALLVGFLLDNFIFLDRIDSLQSYALISFYLVLAAAAIALINLVEEGKLTGQSILKIAPYIPVVMQYAFGGLFSAFLAVYSRSASVLISWIFVLVIAALLVGNERFRKHYVRLPFQVGIYFIGLFSFLIFFLPILFRRIDSIVFVVSGAASLAITALLLYGLRRLVPELLKRERTRVARSVAIIFVLFNVLYFTNAIPPLPLALKDAGVYHGVMRQGALYVLQAEEQPWYQKYLPLDTSIHIQDGADVYVFTAVFAPTGLATTLLHEWQYYDPEEGRWLTRSTVRFTISGGREGGFRGYTLKRAPEPGRWRVNVLTTSRQVIGRVGFIAVNVAESPPLIEIER